MYQANDTRSLRQYPLYSKKEPPKALAEHFTPEVFAKSQVYGKDKAKFALLSGLYKQVVESALLQYGCYALAWDVAGKVGMEKPSSFGRRGFWRGMFGIGLLGFFASYFRFRTSRDGEGRKSKVKKTERNSLKQKFGS